MKLHVADFKEGVPLEVSQEYDPKNLDLEFVDLKYLSKLQMDGTVERTFQTLIFRGHLVTKVEHLCGRCLKVIQDKVDRTFEFFYEIAGREDIETIDDIREAVLLEHPISYLCQEECKGLCPNCGINLNEKQCDCHSKMRNNLLADIGKIRIKDKEARHHGKS